ncbi:MAG: ferrous iron transporter B, partial [Clostridiaceae bacterium]|nr:ferrous iron transporter B [Clostridiaceae bacterium]
MGLTSQSTGTGVLENDLRIERAAIDDKIITLAGNPNVGKSTVFNSLTGLNQHTGNWPGKTVSNAKGKFMFRDRNFVVVDVPGTYSLMANSLEEEVARDFICFGRPDATIVVTDATCLERNLNLVLQTLEITDKVVVCVNLIDEAKRKRIHIDYEELSAQLGVPVVPTSARSNKGLNKLMSAVYDIANKQINLNPYKISYDDAIEQAVKIIEPKVWELVDGKINNRWVALKLLDGDANILNSLNNYLGFNLLDNSELGKHLAAAIKYLEDNGITREMLRDIIVSKLVGKAEEISSKTVSCENKHYNLTDRKIDCILTSRIYGIPIMLGLLGLVFWLTIEGANIPSQIIASFLFRLEDSLSVFF